MKEQDRARMSMLQQLQQQQQELAITRQLLEERSSATLGALIDGLGFQLARAKAGDPAARRALQRLSENLEQARVLGRIQLVDGSGPPRAG